MRPGVAMLVELNRLLTFDDLVAHYGGPRPLWEKLRPGLPVFTAHDGVPVYLESQVDAYLKAVSEGVRLSSGVTPARLEAGAGRESGESEYLTVAEAQRRYLAGAKSPRWWYRMVETGRIAYHRVGGSILLRPADILEFIKNSRTEDRHDESAGEPLPPSPPVPAPSPARTRRNQDEDNSRFQFFPRR